MNNALIENINDYISYLNRNGLSVSVHGKMISGLLEHNVHANPFCTFVKTSDEAWKKCIKCQQKIYGRYQKDCLFGMCHAGVEEYVFFVDEKTFISVSGYGIHAEKSMERINRLSEEFFINKAELTRIYETELKHAPEDIADLKARIYPLCHMLQLLQLTLGEALEMQTTSRTFDSVMAFVQRNLMQNISIRDIAAACACSESTVSHLFKQYTGRSVKKYLADLRIKQAEKLLLTSALPVGSIALLCGFNNTNYFSTCFKKATGLSPNEYKKQPAER